MIESSYEASGDRYLIAVSDEEREVRRKANDDHNRRVHAHMMANDIKKIEDYANGE